jgi:hypothetical protein
VQVRPHLGARLRADALLALGGQRAHEPDDPWREDDPQHGGHHEHREDDVARGGQRVGHPQEDEAGGDHEGRADAVAREDLRALAALLLRCRGLLGGFDGCRSQRLAPQHSAARGQQHDRPHDRVGEPDPERAHREQEGQGDEAHPGGDLDRAASAGKAPRPGGRAAVVGRAVVDGDEHPCEPVEQDPHAAGRGRGHEDDAHDQRVDAEVTSDPGADAADEPVRMVSAQRLAARRGGRGGAHVALDHASDRGPSVAAGEAGGQQDVAHEEAREWGHRREAEVDRVERVGHQHRAEDDEPEAGDQGRQVGAAVVHVHASLPGTPSQSSCSL